MYGWFAVRTINLQRERVLPVRVGWQISWRTYDPSRSVLTHLSQACGNTSKVPVISF